MLNELILHFVSLEEDPIQGIDDIEWFILYHSQDFLLLGFDHPLKLLNILGCMLADLADDRIPQLLLIQS